jgi:hypothetical protein
MLGVVILRMSPNSSQFTALQQRVEELSQNMQALLQTAQEMLQNIQAFLETPRTNVTVLQDAGNAAAPYADVAASKRLECDGGIARRGGRGIYAVDEGGEETAAESRRQD